MTLLRPGSRDAAAVDDGEMGWAHEDESPMSVDCVAFHVKTELDRVGDPHIIGSQAHMSFFGGFLPEAICPLLPN